MTTRTRGAALRTKKRSRPPAIPSKTKQLAMLEELRELETKNRKRSEEGSKDFDRMRKLKKDLGIDPF
jgi:hypothetical protein